MAILNNTASEIGDEILIHATTPIFGVVSLSSFTDDVVGETSSKFFKKEFSYSIDGIFFSGWIPLTAADLAMVTVSPTSSFFIHYKYTRVGTDGSGLLAFNKVNINGIFTTPVCQNYFILPLSIFSSFYCNNPQHALLCSVLTHKMFEKGILPESIIRNQTDDPQTDDKDFLDFWGTVCCFFALQLMLGKKIEKFDSFLDSLQDFLVQRDVIFCQNDTSISDLQYIKSNYYDEIRQRGTWNIFEEKGFQGKPVDGEFLRLICYKEFCDEFFWDLIDNQEIGWWLGKCSPMYKGTLFSNKIIKTEEKTKDFISLANYKVFQGNGGDVNLVYIPSEDKNIARIKSVPDGEVAGFAPDLNAANQKLDKLIKVDEHVDYEITFWVKQNLNVENLSFGVMGYDCDGNEIFPRKTTDDSPTNFFFTEQKLNKINQWYFVRGILFNKNVQQFSVDQARLDIGFGNHLKSFDKMSKIFPYLVQDRKNNPDQNGIIDLWDFKIRPMVKGAVANTTYNDGQFIPLATNEVDFGSFATGFLTSTNLLHVVYKDQNENLSPKQIYDKTRQKLIPYNSNLLMTELTPKPPPGQIVFKQFDFLVVKYTWAVSSGNDVDTRTTIIGTGDAAIDDLAVGYKRGNLISGTPKRRYIGSLTEPYLLWGGDWNSASPGQEQVLINFKKLAIDKPLQIDFVSELKAFWYGARYSGDLVIEMETFLGGTMSPLGLGFVNTGGVSVDTASFNTNSITQISNASYDGDILGKIKYNKVTKQAVLSPI